MKLKPKSDTPDRQNLQKLVGEIQKEQRKIDRFEGDIVASRIRLGNHLAQLRRLANGDWAKQLSVLEMSPRVASRYLKIAQHWPTEIGLKESDLLPRLPTDLLKLEWLCRVPQDRLGPLLDELDCKRANRRQVVAAVRDVLDEAPPARTERDAQQFVERFTNRIMRTVDKLHETFPDAEQQDQARELLVIRFREIQVALEAQIDPSRDS